MCRDWGGLACSAGSSELAPDAVAIPLPPLPVPVAWLFSSNGASLEATQPADEALDSEHFPGTVRDHSAVTEVLAK